MCLYALQILFIYSISTCLRTKNYGLVQLDGLVCKIMNIGYNFFNNVAFPMLAKHVPAQVLFRCFVIGM